MTDNEKAEEFANNGYALGCTKSSFEAAKQAYIAGLKTGRKEKWHDLRKNPKDLPNGYRAVLNQEGKTTIYDPKCEVW